MMDIQSEYKVIQIGSSEDLEVKLNEAATDGWTVRSINSGIVVMVRRK
jgi:hypothetical protein